MEEISANKPLPQTPMQQPVIQQPIQQPIQNIQYQQPAQKVVPQQNVQPVQNYGSNLPIRRCKAIFQMDKQSPNELALKEGDIIVIESEADGWYLGTNTRGERGIFPASFVMLV